MKETKNKNVFSSILIAIFFLVLSVASGYSAIVNSGADNLYKQGKVLTETTSSGKVALEVIGIYPEPLVEIDGGTEVYLLAYSVDEEHFSYIGLESKSSDKVLKELIAKADSLETKPQVIEAEVISAYQEEAIQDYDSYMTSFFEEDEEMAQYFETHRYVSIAEVASDKWWGYGFMVVAGAFGIGFIYSAISSRRNNVKVYETLYTTYPELNGNLDQLIQGASYHQDQLGLLVYKNHLMSYKQSVTLVELSEIASLHHEIINHKRYFITVSRSSSLKITRKDGKTLVAAFKNIGKTTDDNLQGLFAYLNAHYPDIVLGYHG